MRIQFLLKNTGMFERLGIMTLSSILKKNSHEVKLILTEELDEEEGGLPGFGALSAIVAIGAVLLIRRRLSRRTK